MVRYHGIFEPHCIRVMKKILRSGSTFLDIGANIGVHSLFASTMVKSIGKVLSIEAASENFEILKRNISHGNVQNVTAMHCAVGDLPGTVSMHLPNDGNSGMYQVNRCGDYENANVPMRTIDSILGELKLEEVDLLKMDIEGSEFAAIRGARVTLQQLRMPLLIEINRAALGQFNTSPEELKKELHDLGYDGWIIANWRFVPISVEDEHDCDECLFLHRNDAINRSRFTLD
jgi:FkbM family methyltransferase